MPSLPSEIKVLQEISAAVVHQRDVSALLYGILDVINRRMGMIRGTFTLLQGDTLIIEASHGLDPAERSLGRYKIGEGITGHVAETGKTHVVPDIRTDNRFLNRTRARNYNRPVAFICVPIYYMDTLAGVGFEPTEYVDISEHIDLKMNMLECHESQLVWMREHDNIDFADMVKTCSRYRGYQCGAEYAEGFRQCNVYLKGTTKRLLP